jgi:hypothetical protein
MRTTIGLAAVFLVLPGAWAEALPGARKLRDKSTAWFKRLRTLPKPSRQRDQELRKKYGDKLQAAHRGYSREQSRVEEVPGGKEVLEAMKPKLTTPTKDKPR